MEMIKNITLQSIVCVAAVWSCFAAAQTMPDQGSSQASVSTRRQYAHPSADDKALAKQIRKQLVHTKGIDASEVMVGVKDGAVLLRGRLESSEQRSRVESVVRAVPGVKSVENQLTLQQTN
ncbi:BON domain-containing protein [Paraburkholderia pallida]|uniref:BON domain-containing protein n=1 Tax=Paraburkholderia pallida TaxID=2547399 RepID=A0A4P7D0C4_9BURK|nr:BON domain-containing protein [Paraburkholderia pallida]QBR01298.1 BON domain-containing protein [Paraburkholderia pallida]